MVDCVLSRCLIFGDNLLHRVAQRRLDGNRILRRHRNQLGHRPDNALEPALRPSRQHTLDAVVVAVQALFHLGKDAGAMLQLVGLPAQTAALLLELLLLALLALQL